MDWYLAVLKKYAEFSGRARRKEYWMFALVNLGICIVLGIADRILGTYPLLYGLYGLAVLLPSIGVGIRRLHDTNRSGWWVLIAAIPLIGWIAIIIFLCEDSNPGDNRYGPNPKTPPTAQLAM